MEHVQIVIVEDEVLIAEDLKDMLMSFGIGHIYMAHTKQQAMEILQNVAPLIALLDIRLEKEFDGLELGEYINTHYHSPFIYITSHSDLESIKRIVKTNPAGYITKPFKKTDLFASINLAMGKLTSKGKEKVLVKDGIKTVVFEPDEIEYLEGDGNYVNVVAAGRKIVARQSLESLLQLLDPDMYFRVHRSFVVNLDKIGHFTKKEILIQGIKIPISRLIQAEFEQKMLRRNKK